MPLRSVRKTLSGLWNWAASGKLQLLPRRSGIVAERCASPPSGVCDCRYGSLRHPMPHGPARSPSPRDGVSAGLQSSRRLFEQFPARSLRGWIFPARRLGSPALPCVPARVCRPKAACRSSDLPSGSRLPLIVAKALLPLSTSATARSCAAPQPRAVATHSISRRTSSSNIPTSALVAGKGADATALRPRRKLQLAGYNLYPQIIPILHSLPSNPYCFVKV